MRSKLPDEIRRGAPFESLEQEAFLSVLRTAAVLSHAFADALRPYRITATQYNLLRILRGAGDRGLPRNELRDRMVAPVPDVTRLLDRLAGLRLVARARSEVDRRVVMTRITPTGLRILEQLDGPIARIHHAQLGHLGAARLHTLIQLLALARERPCPESAPAPTPMEDTP